MASEILVVCASRGRNIALQAMLDSARSTASGPVDFAVRVDDDDETDYGSIEGISLHRGPRVGPCASLNELVEAHPGYSVYGAVTDDCEFTSRHWDVWVRQRKDWHSFLAPRIPGSSRMDFPWMTGSVVRALGFMCPPRFTHFYWDVALEILGDQHRMIAAPEPGVFDILHFDAFTDEFQERRARDLDALMNWCVFERRDHAQRLRRHS